LIFARAFANALPVDQAFGRVARLTTTIGSREKYGRVRERGALDVLFGRSEEGRQLELFATAGGQAMPVSQKLPGRVSLLLGSSSAAAVFWGTTLPLICHD
jgi:hypothetical protein